MDTQLETIITTLNHIYQVQNLLGKCISELQDRLINHDKSKIYSKELLGFSNLPKDIKEIKYGSQEYQEVLEKLHDTLDHHYSSNRHHPEHFKNGINDMHLIDILEMTVDWICASQRSQDGNPFSSLSIQQKRFNMDPQLTRIIENTIKHLICENTSK